MRMGLSVADFQQSVSRDTPPAGLSGPLQALWWARKDEWEKAHTLVMKDDSAEAAWVHAYLHRVEGDLPNARYWYGTAGRPAADGALDAEWSAIAAALLAGGGKG
jgi:hypothetical protein